MSIPVLSGLKFGRQRADSVRAELGTDAPGSWGSIGGVRR